MIANIRNALANVVSGVRAESERLTSSEPWLGSQKLYRIVMLSWFFLHTAILVPYVGQIFSPDAYLPAYSFGGTPLSYVVEIILHPAVAPLWPIFVAGQLATLALAVFGVRPRLMTVLAWFFTQNLNAKSAVIMDGGNNLSEILLFYMMFMNTTGERLALPTSRIGQSLHAFATGLSNGAFLLSRFQVFVVYLTVGLFKLNGHLWQTGMALYYILQSREYTHPVLGGFLVRHEWLAMAGTYYTLAFQAMFPYLVWMRKTRPYILLMGTTLHLGIAFVMGLFTFGLVMCASYFVFFPESWAQAVLGGARQARATVFAKLETVARGVGAYS